MPASTKAKAAVEEATEAASDQFDKALSEFKGRAQSVAHETLETLRAQAAPYVDTASHRIDEAERYVTEKVHKQPLTALFAALGVGVVLGVILAGGRSR